MQKLRRNKKTLIIQQNNKSTAPRKNNSVKYTDY